jgi:hypothetical protein
MIRFVPGRVLGIADQERVTAGAGAVTRLPLAAPPARRQLPLADSSRTRDRALRPRVAVWELTLRCNLACIHCGSRAGKARTEELTTEECLGLVEELAQLSVAEVSLIGGEAHLHPGFLDVLRALKAHGIEVGMTTGGRGIDAALARAAAAAGLDSVSISLEGYRGRSKAPSARSRRFVKPASSFRSTRRSIAPIFASYPSSWNFSSRAAPRRFRSRSPSQWAERPITPRSSCNPTSSSRCSR